MGLDIGRLHGLETTKDEEALPDVWEAARVSPPPTLMTASRSGVFETLTTARNTEQIDGTPGDDVIRVTLDFDSSVTVDGGAGTDRLILRYQPDPSSFSTNFFGGSLDMSTGIGGGDYDIIVLNFESLDFTGGGDTDNIIGTGGDDIIRDGGFYSSFFSIDTLEGLGGNDVIDGAGGDDIIIGTGGQDVLIGGDGNDTITSGPDSEVVIFDGSFTDIYPVEAQADISGGAGNDTIFSFGDDTIDAGSGDDIVFMGQSERNSATLTDGGTGRDRIDFSTLGSGEVAEADIFFVVDLQGQAYSLRDTSTNTVVFVDTFAGFEDVVGSDFRDLLQGDAGDNLLMGGGGDDTLQGRGGTDIAVYASAAMEDYLLILNADGSYTIEALGGTGEGTDILDGIETVRLGGIDGTDYAIADLLDSANTRNLSSGDDVFSGTDADETINGLDGDDVIDGGAGTNTLNGGNGNDTLISLGNDTLSGGAGDDLVEMGRNVFDMATVTDGGAGTDTLAFATLAQLPSGALRLVVDLRGQAYSLRDGSTVLYVDQFTGFENVTGSELGDVLQGDDSANVISGLGGDDILQGRSGDDLFVMGTGANSVDGGTGFDTADYSGLGSGITFDFLGQVAASGEIADDTLAGVERLIGTDFADQLFGSNTADTLEGGAGNDRLSGRTGNDLLLGGGGDDILVGGAGFDTLDGGDGMDTASYEASTSAIVFDGLGLVGAQGDIANDTLVDIEAIRGTDFADRLNGDNGESVFYGGDGNDRLFGRNGDDRLFGEGGNDIILSGRDDDLLSGGDGNDQLRGNQGEDILFGGIGNDVLAGGAGADVLDGGEGIDRVEYAYGTNAGVTASLADSTLNTGDAAGDIYSGIENISGTSFEDMLFGDAGDNRVDGRRGDDVLFGGDGRDYLIGGAGDDVLDGGSGDDLMLGQSGRDIFQFGSTHGTDRIFDFAQGEDRIEFTDGLIDFDDLTLTQSGSSVVIDTDAGRIIISNALVADFDADDFIFADAAV